MPRDVAPRSHTDRPRPRKLGQPHINDGNSAADAPEAHTVAGVTDPKQKRRIIFSSLVGTTIEFNDFYIYATAAVAVFPFLFFPAAEDPTIGLLSSFATFGLAFVARPLGSLLFVCR